MDAPDRSIAGHLPPPGERAPLETGAAGRAILAHLHDDEASEVLGIRRSGKTMVDHLSVIRDDGYAMSFSGNRAGANGVAAPILDPEERIPLGSIAVAGPAHRVPEAVLRTHQWPSGGRARIWHHSSPPCSAPHAPRRQATPDITVFDLIESGEPQNEGDHPQPQPLTTPSVSRLRRDADVSSQDVATPPRCQATRMSASPGGTSCSTRIGIRPTRSPWRLGRPPAPR